MALSKPFAIPGLEKALLEFLLTLGAIVVAGLTIVVSSIIGIVRARRRRRRGERSVGAVVLASLATILTICWLLYWVAADIQEKHSPLDIVLAIYSLMCALPLWWTV